MTDPYIHPSLKRKTPMSTGKPLPRTSKPRKRSVGEDYRDAHGVAFADVRFLLGEDRSKWPKVTRVEDPTVCKVMHLLFPFCWKSGLPKPQAHHGFSGFTRGHSDEFCAIFMLAEEWHKQVNTPALPLGELLWLKWKHDRPHCDWVRATRLYGSFLPDLITKG